MRVIVFGAAGMLGQGVLRECLDDERVTAVLTVGSPAGVAHPKLREVRHDDLLDLTPIASELAGYDACFSCLTSSSARMREPEYRRVTYDSALSVARTLAEVGPGSTFVYLSRAGADARSRTMWARVTGETENALLALPLDVYVFRPGYVQPTHRTGFYRLAYVVAAPFYPVLRRLFPSTVTTAAQVGRAMIAVAERGAPGRVLDAAAINAL